MIEINLLTRQREAHTKPMIAFRDVTTVYDCGSRRDNAVGQLLLIAQANLGLQIYFGTQQGPLGHTINCSQASINVRILIGASENL